jgi:hypothetical protein
LPRDALAAPGLQRPLRALHDTYTNKAATIQDTGVLDFAPLTAMGQWRSDTIHKYVVYYMLYTRVHGIDTSWQFDWRRPRLFVPFDQRSSETVRDDFYSQQGKGFKRRGYMRTTLHNHPQA